MRSTSPAPAVTLALLPWPLVGLALYQFHSAWLAFALYHALCLASWLAFRAPLPAIPYTAWRNRHWIALGVACLAVNIAVYLFAGLFSVLLQPAHLQAALTKIHAAGGPLGLLALFAYFAVVNPIFEELFWRGTIYTRLRAAHWPVMRSAVVSGALFGAWHLLPVVLLLTPAVAALSVTGIIAVGIALAVFYERSRSLPAVILLHAIGADIPILIALWVDVVARH